MPGLVYVVRLLLGTKKGITEPSKQMRLTVRLGICRIPDTVRTFFMRSCLVNFSACPLPQWTTVLVCSVPDVTDTLCATLFCKLL